MKGKLIKLNVGVGYRLDDENGNLIATTLASSKTKLSFKNCEAIELGYDLDELAKKYTKEADDIGTKYLGKVLGNNNSTPFKDGFKKALEILGDKKFNENDIDKAFDAGHEMLDSPKKYNDVLTEFKESLQQTEWDVEVEMEKVKDKTKIIGAVKGVKGSGDKITTYKEIPKLNADGCLILKII